MVWENKSLRDIAEADVRQLVNSGLEEHLQLEYKSALYDGNDRGSRESLLDICMFANAGGGILLIGVSERRDAEGQPTGSPDPNAPLGINVPNPEMVLQSYDARVVANIEDRLPLESAAIPVANGFHVLAIRVANSTAKPHCVRYQGHVYFPSRRERQRYEMDVREIKEMVMRTASRIEEAERMLGDALMGMPRQDDSPYLIIGSIPVFWRDFTLDVSNEAVVQAVGMFDLADPRNFRHPSYTFTGLERPVHNDNSTVQARRNGLIVLNRRILTGQNAGRGAQDLYPEAIDLFLRKFVVRAANVYKAANISGPHLLGMMLRASNALVGLYQDMFPSDVREAAVIAGGDYRFPTMQADSLADIDRLIRPLCDQAHQMFGRDASPLFSREGAWAGPMQS